MNRYNNVVELVLRANGLTPSQPAVRAIANQVKPPMSTSQEKALGEAIHDSFPFVDWEKVAKEIISCI